MLMITKYKYKDNNRIDIHKINKNDIDMWVKFLFENNPNMEILFRNKPLGNKITVSSFLRFEY